MVEPHLSSVRNRTILKEDDMKKGIIFSLLLLVLPASSLAGGRLPDVQAICRMTLKTGETVEGIVLIARGGSGRYCDTDGFYIELRDRPEIMVVFDLSFFAFEPDKGIIEVFPSSRGRWEQYTDPKVFYLRDISSASHKSKKSEITMETERTDSAFILKRDVVLHAEYELLDYVPVYPRVPEELYLRTTKSIEPLHISTGNIKRFEFIIDPASAWLEQISSVARQRKGEDTSIDLKWFHDIMRDTKQYRDIFKPQRF